MSKGEPYGHAQERGGEERAARQHEQNVSCRARDMSPVPRASRGHTQTQASPTGRYRPGAVSSLRRACATVT